MATEQGVQRVRGARIQSPMTWCCRPQFPRPLEHSEVASQIDQVNHGETTRQGIISKSHRACKEQDIHFTPVTYTRTPCMVTEQGFQGVRGAFSIAIITDALFIGPLMKPLVLKIIYHRSVTQSDGFLFSMSFMVLAFKNSQSSVMLPS